MSNPFIGEIQMFGGNFAPRGWALCDGQLLAISSNDALFSLLGTIYGGDGRTTFALPDLRGRAPLSSGNGPGLSARSIGSNGGSEQVTLTTSTMPSHTHAATVNAHSTGTDAVDPTGNALAASPAYSTATPDSGLLGGSATAGNTGGGGPHENMQPFGVVNYIIALVGVYPSRN